MFTVVTFRFTDEFYFLLAYEYFLNVIYVLYIHIFVIYINVVYIFVIRKPLQVSETTNAFNYYELEIHN